MKKTIIITATLLMSLSVLLSVEEDVKKRFENTEVVKAKETEIVKLEVMKPDIERYQKKKDTVVTNEYYRINKTILRSTNNVLLNKWLKELK
jgi:TfoX/Sxy family transcriptional regulator of competence genes